MASIGLILGVVNLGQANLGAISVKDCIKNIANAIFPKQGFYRFSSLRLNYGGGFIGFCVCNDFQYNGTHWRAEGFFTNLSDGSMVHFFVQRDKNGTYESVKASTTTLNEL